MFPDLQPGLSRKRERRIEPDEESRSFDLNFKISNVHMAYLNFARRHDGIFRPSEYDLHLLYTTKNPNMYSQRVEWSRQTVAHLTQAGYFKKVRDDEYHLNLAAMEFLEELHSRRKEFNPGRNYWDLLMLHNKGTLDYEAAAAKFIPPSSPNPAQRRKIFRGMLNKLKVEGFLENPRRGVYLLTPVAMEFLTKPIQSAERRKQEHPDGLSLGLYDVRMMQYVATDPLSGEHRLDLSWDEPSIARLRKREDTLRRNGLIREEIICEELWQRLQMKKQLRDTGQKYGIANLSGEQKTLLREMRQFELLNFPRVTEYIYHGNRALAAIDVNDLISNGYLRYSPEHQFLVLTATGLKQAGALIDIDTRYSPRYLVNPYEMAHDMMIYPSFKGVEGEILAAGGEIIEVRTDKQLRREMAVNGDMEWFPDVRLTYRDATGKELQRDIEVDRGYDERVIAAKVAGFLAEGNNKAKRGGDEGAAAFSAEDMAMEWVVHSPAQAARVANVLKRPDTINILSKRRKIRLLMLSEQGYLKELYW
ncbi:MAG: hypothetical protein FWE76_01975 [Symbiobacteriaceae bacterium]|nr:hypothetical protein [Symbiobacteriaceae bacterium]